MERFRTWHEILMERLSDPEDVIGYLEVSLEEYLDDGDKAFFLTDIVLVLGGRTRSLNEIRSSAYG